MNKIIRILEKSSPNLAHSISNNVQLMEQLRVLEIESEKIAWHECYQILQKQFPFLTLEDL